MWHKAIYVKKKTIIERHNGYAIAKITIHKCSNVTLHTILQSKHCIEYISVDICHNCVVMWCLFDVFSSMASPYATTTLLSNNLLNKSGSNEGSAFRPIQKGSPYIQQQGSNSSDSCLKQDISSESNTDNSRPNTGEIWARNSRNAHHKLPFLSSLFDSNFEVNTMLHLCTNKYFVVWQVNLAIFGNRNWSLKRKQGTWNNCKERDHHCTNCAHMYVLWRQHSTIQIQGSHG